jgi:hypothetical protein
MIDELTATRAIISPSTKIITQNHPFDRTMVDQWADRSRRRRSLVLVLGRAIGMELVGDSGFGSTKRAADMAL